MDILFCNSCLGYLMTISTTQCGYAAIIIFERVTNSQIPIWDFRNFEIFNIWEHFSFFAASQPILTQN